MWNKMQFSSAFLRSWCICKSQESPVKGELVCLTGNPKTSGHSVTFQKMRYWVILVNFSPQGQGNKNKHKEKECWVSKYLQFLFILFGLGGKYL